MGRPASDLDDYLDWQERLENYKASDLEVDVFYLQEGVSRTTFYKWARRLKDGIPGSMLAEKAGRERAESGEAVFVPISLKASPVEIELPNGGIVRLPLGVGQAVLVEVIRAVGAAPLEGTEVMMNFSDVRIFLCTTPTNMNYSFDRLMGRAQEIFDQDPTSGHLFLFVNRSRDRIKILFWDRDGFCIWYKRLERGTFQLLTTTNDEEGIELDYSQLVKLLGGIDLRTGRRRRRYRRIG